MGEVYRASDTNLKRQVAIKVLPTPVAGDAERLARFQREAEILAALNHPNIAHIHGLERSDGMVALVMELVDGPTLADRISQGPVSVVEALPIAKQIAEALEAAHEQGIIHRDLKPANIKVRADGTVKVLDFGLAKAIERPAMSSTNVSQSPTITTPAMTQAGIILGTAAYMSPEQAVGKQVDKRTDLWAFGVILMEMLTGRHVFDGETVSHVLAAVLKDEPKWSALPADTPTSIRRLLRRCLEKDRRRRIADAADVRLEIEDLAIDGPAMAVAARYPNKKRRALIAASVALGILAIAAIVTFSLKPVSTAASEWAAVQFLIDPPTATRFSLRVDNSARHMFALSPDGKQLALVATSDDGVSRIWIRSLMRTEARVLADTEQASYPFWSPDGRSVAFFANGRLKVVSPDGSIPPRTVCDAGAFGAQYGGTWSTSGTIVFASGAGVLSAVPAAGGIPIPATIISDEVRVTESHRFPQFLPDGKHFLYAARRQGDEAVCMLVNLDRLLKPPNGLWRGRWVSTVPSHCRWRQHNSTNGKDACHPTAN